MKIEKIRMTNFRNLQPTYDEPSEGLNVFLGNNAQGKTSFLEGIYLLARPVSFRPARDAELLQYDCRQFFVEALCQKKEGPSKLTVRFEAEKGKKEFFLNEKKTAYREANPLKVVLFTPNDLGLVQGAPAYRRRYMDFLLCQLSTEYERHFGRYQGILKKRNQLLAAHQQESSGFEAVNQMFAAEAAGILWQRLRVIQRLQEILQEIFPAIYAENFTLSMRYALSFPMPQGVGSEKDLYEGLLKQIEQGKQAEEEHRSTLYGPHKDDLNLYLNERLARKFASQGQQRSIAIAMKLAEVLVYQAIRGEYPVFLLDEVLAELDHERRKTLFTWLKTAEFQSFLTAVNLDGLEEVEGVQIRYFSKGVLQKKKTEGTGTEQ